MRKIPASPFSAWYLDILTLILAAILMGIVYQRGNSWLGWFYHLLFERGLLQFFIFYFFLRAVVAYFLAWRRKSLPAAFSKQLLGFSFLPLLLGLVGMIQGIGRTIAGSAMFYDSNELIDIKKAILEMLIGAGISLDTLFLGLLATIFCLGLYNQAVTWTQKYISPQVADTPPVDPALPVP